MAWFSIDHLHCRHVNFSMLNNLIISFLISLSPFGEARVGIPYAILNEVPFAWAFFVGLAANLLVFPLLIFLIDRFDRRFWPNRHYKKSVVRISRLARKKTGTSIEKYGFWGLMIFVMIPLPGTGAYLGTIAASVFKIDRRKAFWAVSLGVFVSCVIMTVAAHFGNIGLDRL